MAAVDPRQHGPDHERHRHGQREPRLLDRLSSNTDTAIGTRGRLTRKVTSTIGVCDFVLVRETENEAAPLGGRNLPLSPLAGSTGYIVVPHDSEGYAAGREVAIHRWP